MLILPWRLILPLIFCRGPCLLCSVVYLLCTFDFLNTLFHWLRFWLEVLLQYNMFWTWICSPSICHSLFLICLCKVKKKRNISKISIWLFADNIWKAPYKSSIYNVHVLHVYNTQQIYILVINTLLCVWNNFITIFKPQLIPNYKIRFTRKRVYG